jgi:putative effector of murein hydrolase
MSVLRAALSSPLFSVALTVGSFSAVSHAFGRWRSAPWASPVLWSTIIVAAAVLFLRIPYSVYAAGSQAITVMLGPAVAALALPIYTHRRRILRALPAVLGATLAASVVGVGVGIGVMALLGGGRPEILVMAPAHATSPVASAVAEATGGNGSLAAVVAVVTGVLGAVIGPPVLDRFGITDEQARGLALGLSAHAIGTARALQESETTGSFSAAGMALGAATVALVTPIAVRLLA